VSTICRRLDGLPLAIELAAARAKVLSPPALLARLSQSLDLLTGGPRDQPERLQTMRSAIAWSYDLLSSEEQELLARVSTFSGGFSLAAAEAIAHPDGSGPVSPRPVPVLDSIGSLVDGSLLRADVASDGETWFTMLETVREFGQEQLRARGERDAVRRRHAMFFLELAERAAPEMYGSSDQGGLLDQIEVNHDNFRAAIGWALESGEADIALRMTGALFFFWYLRGHMTEGRRWLERALAMDEGQPGVARAQALVGAGFLANWQGDSAAAVPLLEEARALAGEVGNAALVVFALALLGIAAEDDGRYERAAAFMDEALAVIETQGGAQQFDPSLFGELRTHRGVVAWGQGDVEFAERLWTEALADQRARSDPWGTSNSLRYLAMTACERNELGPAADLQRESLTLIWRARAMDDLADAFSITATIATKRGQFVPAARQFGAAEALREEIGGRAAFPERILFERSESALRLALSEQSLRDAWMAGRVLGPAAAVTEALELLSADAVSSSASSAPNQALTARERDVLRLLVMGRTDKEIADSLFISPRTAQGHVARLFDKLGVNTRSAAVAAALQADLVPD
jgi:non-specific serine/threonine protein kinase